MNNSEKEFELLVGKFLQKEEAYHYGSPGCTNGTFMLDDMVFL